MQSLLENLNPVQREAVTATEGPLLVVAGAGSGKTRVLTSRVAYILMERLARPSNILAVTFTNKAAREMRERVVTLLGTEIHALTISTFHSFCAMLLRREAEAIGYPRNFTIFDEDDAQALIKHCLEELDLSKTQFTPRSLRRKISDAKNRMEDAETYAKKASGYFENKTAAIYRLYENRLRQFGGFDFDDLIFRTVQLLKGREDIRENYRNRFKYVLVDEYQDTNHSQYELLKLLVGEHRNICVVGDEDQSIYGWRGADITNILNFEKDFPGARVIKLEQNYRSTEVILDAASAVIANNINRKGKVLWTEQKEGEPVQLIMTDNASDEAAAVIGYIEQNRSRYTLKDMAILYRTNAQSRAFEEHLRRLNLPYQIIGGVSFYQRKEIKDLVAYLKLIANPADDVSFRRIINYPRRGIGDATIAKLREFSDSIGKSLLEASARVEESTELGSRPTKLLKEFSDRMQKYLEMKETEDIATIAQTLIDDLKLAEILIQEDSLVGQERVKNVEEFVNAADEFTAHSEEPTLDNFLAEISLYTDLDEYREIEDKLTLMTLHAAKGLEFDAVFMVGLEEGLFPLGMTIDKPMQLEEERRLFYVGATRARKNLFISFASVRGRFGDMESMPSRFIKELPPALVEKDDRRSYVRNGYGRSQVTLFSKPEKAKSATNGYHYEYEEDEILRVGRIVEHATFGRGKVTKVEGTGESLRVEIYFTGIGPKKIMPRFAKLQIIG